MISKTLRDTAEDLRTLEQESVDQSGQILHCLQTNENIWSCWIQSESAQKDCTAGSVS
jgi:hypothetical protein